MPQHNPLVNLTGSGIAAHKVKRALANTNPAHTVMNAAGTQTFLRQHEAAAVGTNAVGNRYTSVVVLYFGMAGIAAAGFAHYG